MLRTRQRDRPRQWPFWLLLLAWACANCPGNLTGAALDWISEAHAFPHQKRLTLDVARLLVGETAPSAVTAATPDLPSRPAIPVLPPGPDVKKSDLATEEVVESRRPGDAAAAFTASPPRPRGVLRAPPPHEPPRLAA